MSPFFFNSFFILVQYILKLNVSSHPPIYRCGEKHCLTRSADPGVLAAGSSFFFTPRVLCLLIFSRKLKEEEWISFLNEQNKLEL
jgi:hypothetical protein